MDTQTHKNALLIGLEFVSPIFSGNGIMTQSLVRGLLESGYHVTVLCARPDSWKEENEVHVDSSTKETCLESHPKLHTLIVPVPNHTWKRLDKHSCWQHLAEGAPKVMKNISHKAPWDYVFCIDWSSIETIHALQECKHVSTSVPLVFLVFRIFSRSHQLLKSVEDQHFYIEKEVDAVNRSDITIVLSHVDKFSLQRIHSERLDSIQKQKAFHILPPPLRFDFREQCQNSAHTTSERKYITCNVRLSPEKNALLFAKVMKLVAEKEILRKLRLIPLMIGAVCDLSYAEEVKKYLPTETVVVEKFLSSSELITYLSQTLLMIHPPTYDAYGMTIAEAAATGTPTIIHEESIGACSLFKADKGEIILGDFSSVDNALDSIEKVLLLSSPNYLGQVGETARQKALSWTVSEYARALQGTLEI